MGVVIFIDPGDGRPDAAAPPVGAFAGAGVDGPLHAVMNIIVRTIPTGVCECIRYSLDSAVSFRRRRG
jgi:hypothetical protein